MKLPYALGIGAVGCPCLGVGAWQIYEEVNPTLGRTLWKEGLSKDPISPGPLKTQEVSTNAASEYLSNENYGCFQWFFPGVNLTESIASGNGDNNKALTNPFSADSSSSSSSPVLGCALMKLVPKDSGTFFLKSEITFKNDTQGWAIWSHLTNHNSKASDKVFLYFRILFLGRSGTDQNWSIKGGVYLKHYGTVISGNPSISTPNGAWSNRSKEKRYAGFWESNDSSDKGLMTDIKIEYGAHNKLFHQGNIYTTNDSSQGLICKGIYNASDKKWSTWATGTNCCISGALTQAFTNFKEKKGKWTDAETYCNEAVKIRYKNVDEKTKTRAKELCYLQTSTSK